MANGVATCGQRRPRSRLDRQKSADPVAHGGTWHVPSEPHVVAATPVDMLPRGILGEDNFCDFCNADPSVECECAGEYHGPLNRRCCAGPDDSEPDDAGKRSEVDMTDEKESGGEQQVYQVRERSRTISVPKPSEPGREEG